MTDRAARSLLVLAVLAAYATSFLGGFQLDDWIVVVADPRVQDLGAWWRSMPGIRPLLKLSYALCHASGLGLAGFHVVNLAVHGASTLLAYALLVRLGSREGRDAEGVRWAAAIGALLFALHPAQTEAVTYVSGRSSALSGMLVLASTLVWLDGRERASLWATRLGSPLLFAAAVAVKETALFLPLALLVLALTDPRARPSPRELFRSIAPHLVVLAAAILAILASATYRGMLAASFALRDVAGNVATQLHAVGWLLGQVVRPDRLDVDPEISAVPHVDASGLATGALLVAVVASGLLLVRRRPGVAFAWLWFVVWLAPAGWFVPRPEPASDRQLYLALLAPAWLVGRAIAAIAIVRAPLARWTIVGMLAVLVGGGTAVRSLVYRDEVRFWSDAVAKSPGNPRAHNNLAIALAASCRREEAERELIRALDRDPGYVRAAANLRLLREGAALDPRGPRCP